MQINYVTYAVDRDTGQVVSRYGNEIAVPVLQFEKMNPKNKFNTSYRLERFAVYGLTNFHSLKWTKKVPLHIKNQHRKLWGLKEI